MTATANQTIISQLEQITGYTFQKSRVFWLAAPQMLEPKVQITFQYTPMLMLALKKRGLNQCTRQISEGNGFSL
jgi:hypothetical protein